MAYATVQDVQDRMTRELTETEQEVVSKLLDDSAVIIDSYNANATADVKQVVSCRMVVRAIGADSDGVPMGATQGSMSGLGYSQSWTIGTGGSVGELYLGKLEKKLLGSDSKIGASNPLEVLTGGEL